MRCLNCGRPGAKVVALRAGIREHFCNLQCKKFYRDKTHDTNQDEQEGILRTMRITIGRKSKRSGKAIVRSESVVCRRDIAEDRGDRRRKISGRRQS